MMKKKLYYLIIIAFFVLLNAKAQTKHYFGSEIGLKLDKFEYRNSTGFKENIYTLNGNLGFYYGKRNKWWNVEVGVYRFYTALPLFFYNKEEKKIQYTGINLSLETIRSDGYNQWMFPIRLSKEYFFNKKQTLFINTAIGANIGFFIYSSGLTGGNATSSLYIISKEKIYQNNVITVSSEGYLALGTRIKKRLDIYLKVVFYNAFSNVFYSEIDATYYDGTQISATNSFNGTAYALLFGIKYNYHNLKQLKKLLQ